VLLFALDPTPLFPDVLRVSYSFVFSISHVFRDTRYFLSNSTTNKEREKKTTRKEQYGKKKKKKSNKTQSKDKSMATDCFNDGLIGNCSYMQQVKLTL
jgi:hypothetical protein